MKKPAVDRALDACFVGLLVAGGACVVAGVWQIYAPAGWIVLGLALIAGALKVLP